MPVTSRLVQLPPLKGATNEALIGYRMKLATSVPLNRGVSSWSPIPTTVVQVHCARRFWMPTTTLTPVVLTPSTSILLALDLTRFHRPLRCQRLLTPSLLMARPNPVRVAALGRPPYRLS